MNNQDHQVSHHNKIVKDPDLETIEWIKEDPTIEDLMIADHMIEDHLIIIDEPLKEI